MRVHAVLALLCLLPIPAGPISLEAVGVLGNSGVAGRRLVRVGPLPFDRSATGVARDHDRTLWVSGGDRINRLSLDGSLVESFALDPAGSSVDSRTFALLAGRLYFLGHRPDGQMGMFALDLLGPDNRAARLLPLELPKRPRDWMPYLLAPQPLDGKLLLACETERDPVRLAVFVLDPEVQPLALEPLFTLPGQYPGGIAVDPDRRVIYLGAEFAVPAGADGFANAYAIHALRPDGSPVSDDFPAPCMKTPAVPTQFRGFVSLACGALWDTAWYGFLSRHDLRGRGAPGRILEWHHEFGYPTQVVGLTELASAAWPDNQLLAVTTTTPEALYLARWRNADRTFTPVSRLGCLPVISSLGLSEDGLVTVGTGRAQLWFRWEDGPTTPPLKAELHIAVTPPFFREGRCFALAAQYRLDDMEKRPPVPTVFKPVVGDRNEGWRNGDPVPFRKPVGLSVRVAPGSPNATVFVTDAATRQIWQAPMWLPDLRPDSAKWELTPLAEPLRQPTDIVALSEDRLLIGDEGRVLLLAMRDGAYRVSAVFDHWGDGPEERLGSRLRIAADGTWMLISDTDRHRVLLVDWTEWKMLAQFGHTDAAGDDTASLNTPAQVAIRLPNVVVADLGNQRLLKLCIESGAKGDDPERP